MKNKSNAVMALAMTIFGTIGIFRRMIPLPSSFISMVRGFVGTLFLILFVVITRKKVSFKAIKPNLVKLIVSGALIGFNWIFLFEAYNYTTVATATLCYYMAPIFVMILAPVFLKAKLGRKEIFTVLVALVGMVFVAGVFEEGINGIKGIVFGLIAALMYGVVVIINKKLSGVNAYEKTLMQLGTAAVVLAPYVLATEDLGSFEFSMKTIVLLTVVGIVHTGLAYSLYFGAMDGMSAISIALFSYIDPVVAILLSVLFLNEPMSFLEYLGAVLVLGAMVFYDMSQNMKKRGK